MLRRTIPEPFWHKWLTSNHKIKLMLPTSMGNIIIQLY